MWACFLLTLAMGVCQPGRRTGQRFVWFRVVLFCFVLFHFGRQTRFGVFLLFGETRKGDEEGSGRRGGERERGRLCSLVPCGAVCLFCTRQQGWMALPTPPTLPTCVCPLFCLTF